jgi:hypothetical protein
MTQGIDRNCSASRMPRNLLHNDTASTADPLLLNLSFYTRMSFYTAEDMNTSVIVNTPFSGEKGITLSTEFWDAYYGDRMIVCTITDERNNEQLIDWYHLDLNNVTFELPLPLYKFSAQEEAYVLHLWAFSKDGNLLFEATTLLRMLWDKAAQGLARRDRLEEQIYCRRPYANENGAFLDQLLDHAVPHSTRYASHESAISALFQPSCFAPHQPEYSSTHTVGNNQPYPTPSPSLYLGPGWWQQVLPATIYPTTWDEVKRTFVEGNLYVLL